MRLGFEFVSGRRDGFPIKLRVCMCVLTWDGTWVFVLYTTAMRIAQFSCFVDPEALI